MPARVLITGGAGFIGSHLADELLNHGYQVRVLDALVPQVHGSSNEGIGTRPAYLASDVELQVGDVRDPHAMRRALQGVDAVFHLAAAVGVGQSMYQIEHYVATNALGTAVLLEALIERPVARLIVASSMSIYGEGLYCTPDGCTVQGVERTAVQMKTGDWEIRDTFGAPLIPIPTPETKVPSVQSIYALSKYDQERLCLVVGSAYAIPTVALRFFNVYGPRQALSNPYTGVLAIFAARLRTGKPPLITEDGNQRRDFVHVRDVTRACRLALETPAAGGQVLNVGSGRSVTIREVAEQLIAAYGTAIAPQITGAYRAGDIRHCFADIALARSVLGYEPLIPFQVGLSELITWMQGQVAVDNFAEAHAELSTRGLLG